MVTNKHESWRGATSDGYAHGPRHPKNWLPLASASNNGMIRIGYQERMAYKERRSKTPGGKPLRGPMLKVGSSLAFRDAWTNNWRDVANDN